MVRPAADSNSGQVETQAFSEAPGEKKPDALPLLLTPAGAAHELSLSRYTVYTLLKSGQLRGRRFGRVILVPREEVVRFAANLEET
jgi:excisionase family DNA binding protein